MTVCSHTKNPSHKYFFYGPVKETGQDENCLANTKEPPASMLRARTE